MQDAGRCRASSRSESVVVEFQTPHKDCHSEARYGRRLTYLRNDESWDYFCANCTTTSEFFLLTSFGLV